MSKSIGPHLKFNPNSNHLLIFIEPILTHRCTRGKVGEYHQLTRLPAISDQQQKHAKQLPLRMERDQ
jgi:hypothetical protein